MLTPRQRQLLDFIQSYAARHGVPPSFDEMREALDLRSKSGVHRLISSLADRGFIRRLPYRARAIELVPRRNAIEPQPPAERRALGSNVVMGHFKRREKPGGLAGSTGTINIPFYGRIAAGTPIEALADNTQVIDVPSGLLADGEHYVLEVVGDSMIEAGIQDGDLVVIQRTDTADNGTIVVALIDDREVTLKRLRRRGASIALEAANPKYETRIFGPQQVKVQGRLVGLMRRY